MLVKLCLHEGAAHGDTELCDGLLVDLTPKGMKVLAAEGLDCGHLVQVQFVRPSRRNSSVGQRLFAVGRVARVRKLGRNGARATIPVNGGKQAVVELGIELMCMDPNLAEWLRELTGKRPNGTK